MNTNTPTNSNIAPAEPFTYRPQNTRSHHQRTLCRRRATLLVALDEAAQVPDVAEGQRRRYSLCRESIEERWGPNPSKPITNAAYSDSPVRRGVRRPKNHHEESLRKLLLKRKGLEEMVRYIEYQDATRADSRSSSSVSAASTQSTSSVVSNLNRGAADPSYDRQIDAAANNGPSTDARTALQGILARDSASRTTDAAISPRLSAGSSPTVTSRLSFLPSVRSLRKMISESRSARSSPDVQADGIAPGTDASSLSEGCEELNDLLSTENTTLDSGSPSESPRNSNGSPTGLGIDIPRARTSRYEHFASSAESRRSGYDPRPSRR